MPDPIIKLDAAGQASIISYNVPEPTSYEGTNIIELDLAETYFTAKAKAIPEGREKPPSAAEIDEAIKVQVQTGVFNAKVFPNARPGLIAGRAPRQVVIGSAARTMGGSAAPPAAPRPPAPAGSPGRRPAR